MSAHIVLNGTAYDGLPSGARSRTVGLAAALLDAGARVTLVSPREHSFGALVEEELGGTPPTGALREIPSPFSSLRPLHRALASRAWLRRHVPADTDVFVTDFYPVLPGVRTALTVHDLRYMAAPVRVSPLRRAWFRRFYPRMARAAWRVVTPTAAMAAEVRELLGVDPARIVVAPNARLRAWREAAPANGRREHLLAVGVVESRKDLETAVEAVRAAADAGGPVLPLVVAGRPGPAADDLARLAGDLVDRGLYRHEGVVSDRRLAELCSRAAALLHPSRYEGFGMSVLEAMSLGVPVLAAGCPAVREVGGTCPTWLPPGDVEAWGRAVREVVGRTPDLNGVRSARMERARGFTWADSARVLLDALGEAGERSSFAR